ncbi:MAG: POTRA domain-containing protein [Caulobacteraceae bacterium]
MLKSTWFATAVAVVGVIATGEGAAAAPPIPAPVGAGGQIQQIPRPLETERSIPDIRVQRGSQPRDAGPAGPKVTVRSLRITGERIFPESELIAVTGFTPGGQFDLHDLRVMAAKISDFYNRRGYFVAQAYVPARRSRTGR